MADSSECPTEQILIDFVAARVDESVRDQVVAHLGTCARCSESVAWIEQNLLKEIKDELGEGSRATEGMESRESVGGETEAWDLMDAEEFDIGEPSAPKGKRAVGRIGKYDVIGVLGRGGMGVVFEAFDERLRRTVAVKVLNRRLSSNDTARRRFIREARAAAGINHQNVVTIHDVDEHKSCPFLVMEYVDGGSLREHIRANRPLEPLEVVRLSKEIAAGLAAAHAQGVIHRDIKPGNIMLEDGALRVKITDFGLARAAVDNVELTSRELAVGTPAYMSPEQVKGEKVDLRSDLFCLGCVMYAMIAGRSPFRGEHALEIARKVADEKPPSLEKVIEGTPKPLSGIVFKLLAKKPDNRYQSATEVTEVLGRYLASLNQAGTDEMSTVLRGHILREKASRAPVRWIMTACIAVVIAVFGSMPFWLPEGDSERPQGVVPGGGDPSGYPELLMVSKSGDADCGSIREALFRAGPGTVIHVLDSGVYSESLEIADCGRLRGIELEAIGNNGERAILKASRDNAPVITIEDVCDVMIRGFRFEASSEGAIVVRGTAANVEIEGIECLQDPGEPGITIQALRLTPEERPICVRNSRFRVEAQNQCIRVFGSSPIGQSVEIEGNHFSGADCVLVLLAANEAPLGDLVVSNNVFVARAETKTNGINLNIANPGPDPKIRISNNTFHNVKHWFGLAHSFADHPGVEICNNLILGSRSIEGWHDQERIVKMAENWQFASNWWEVLPDAPDDVTLGGRIATKKEDIKLLDRVDENSPDYLRPPSDSPLFTSGYGEEGLPGYIGARGPEKQSED